MRTYGRLGLLAAMLMFVPLQVRAQDADTTGDIRCVVVALRISTMPAAPQQSAVMLALYYIGRLDGRAPKLDLEDLIIKELGKMTAADYASEAQRCGGSLTEKGQQITKIGQDLIQRGQNTQDQATPVPKP
jgi:hypothetical protein